MVVSNVKENLLHHSYITNKYLEILIDQSYNIKYIILQNTNGAIFYSLPEAIEYDPHSIGSVDVGLIG